MKLGNKLLLSSILLVSASSGFAIDGLPKVGGGALPFGQGDLSKYLLNLGSYMGFDLKNSNPNPVSEQLLNMPIIQVPELSIFNTFLGALIVSTSNPSSMTLVPNSIPNASAINSFVNTTFSSPTPYNSPSSGAGVSVSALIDQKTYQNDPVSQAVLNILGTPDYSYCLTNDGSQLAPNCNPSTAQLNQAQVILNTLGTIPGTYQYFTYDYNKQIIGQLNANSLISPLMYSVTDSNSSSTSSGTPAQQDQNQGLVSQNQGQDAANFIRYVANAVVPLSQPTLSNYDALYTQASQPITQANALQVKKAQATLANYLASVRVYAAQNSVGVANLYYMLSKRLPQNMGGSDASNQTSQALSEFNMATWRIYNSDPKAPSQWLNQINNASPATVQKEIAALLAEINYQMYLNRQQEERILLTNTILLFQNSRMGQPNATLTGDSASSS